MATAGSLQEVARENVVIHAKGKGGNAKFTCNHCKREFTGSQIRQLAHLTGTSGSGIAAFKALMTVVSEEWDEWAAKRDYREKAKVYPECLAIQTHIENCKLPEDVRPDVAEIFRERWDKMHSPLHSVAYMLSLNIRVRKDFRDGARRMVETSDEYKAVLSQHTKFTNKEGIYGDEDIMSLTQEDSEHSIPTNQFWAGHGHETPGLAAVAKRVTSMVSVQAPVSAIGVHMISFIPRSPTREG
ncbi:TPA: hypothetical protein ACH3X1_008201 [Trebouxia sp. C0004]